MTPGVRLWRAVALTMVGALAVASAIAAASDGGPSREFSVRPPDTDDFGTPIAVRLQGRRLAAIALTLPLALKQLPIAGAPCSSNPESYRAELAETADAIRVTYAVVPECLKRTDGAISFEVSPDAGVQAVRPSLRRR